MLLFLLANFLIVLIGVSIVWELLAWREVLSGKVALDSLRLLTAVLDKMKLIKIFGRHDEDMVFNASAWQIIKSRSPIKWLFGNKLVELFFLYILIDMAWKGSHYGWWSIVGIIVYYGIGYLFFSFRSKKVAYQMTHEKLKKFGPKSDTGFRFDHLGGGKTADRSDLGGKECITPPLLKKKKKD